MRRMLHAVQTNSGKALVSCGVYGKKLIIVEESYTSCGSVRCVVLFEH